MYKKIEKLDKRINGEYVINVALDNKQAEQHIALYEQSIINDKLILNENMPFLETAKSEYDKFNTIVSGIQAKIAASEAMLHSLVAFRSNVNPNKTITLIRSKSHLEQPVVVESKQKRAIRWMDFAIPILKEVNRFMSGDDLASTILAKNTQFNPDVYEKKVKHWIFYCHPSSIKSYNGKFGLKEWFMDEKTPLPQYMTAFMHGDSVVKMKAS